APPPARPAPRSAAEAISARTGPSPSDPSAPDTADPAAPGPSGPDGAAPGEPTPDATTAPAPDHPQPAGHPDHRDAWPRPGLDPRELRRMGEDLTYRADPDAVEERQRKRLERRSLSFGITLDEVGTISGACSDALSIEIIKTAADAGRPPRGPGDTRAPAAWR